MDQGIRTGGSLLLAPRRYFIFNIFCKLSGMQKFINHEE
jgi:hypothetical protein